MKQQQVGPAQVENIYRLDGRVPVSKAIPFSLQHVLAMFVANVTPVMLIAGVAVYNGVPFSEIDKALLIQAAMLVAGIGTLVQFFPVWRIGSRLPVVMGLSFTFLSAMMTLASRDYGLMIGAVIVGGCVEGLLGLTAKYWRRFVSPIVSASFCIGIGVTQVPGFFAHMPQIVSDIFQGNPVAGVFVVAMLMSLLLPKDVHAENIDALTDDTIDRQ